MLADFSGCATRFAQTVLAEFLESAPLLGHTKGIDSSDIVSLKWAAYTAIPQLIA